MGGEADAVATVELEREITGLTPIIADVILANFMNNGG